MKKGKKVFLSILLAALGFMLIGVASYILFFQEDTNKVLEGDEQNAAVAVVRNIVYKINDAKEITSENSMCLDYGKGCAVTTPDIIVDSEYEVLGWSEASDGKGTMYYVNSEIIVDKDMTLYAVTNKKEEKELELGVNVCNKKIKCNIGNNVVDIACSQVGYVEKETDSSLDDCTANPGINDYQKFGNNGNIWDATFVNWVFENSKISLKNKGIEDVHDVNFYVKWAQNNNKWFTSKSSLKDGDLILTNNNQHIGIAVNIGQEWYMIAGNHNNKVELVVADNISGFINMKGLSY